MTGKRITIIDGHPDPAPGRFVHALAERCAEGAAIAGHELRRIVVADLTFPLIATRQDWENGEPVADIRTAQEAISWAEHIIILYPLWLGDMPALLKAFFEQVMRPGYAFLPHDGGFPRKKLKGRSAHVVVTMGMPAFFYRLFYGAHSVKSLERNILKFVGIAPVRHSLLGNVEASAAAREGWLEDMFTLGETAS